MAEAIPCQMDQRATCDSQIPLAPRTKPPSRRTAIPQRGCDPLSALPNSPKTGSVPILFGTRIAES